MNPTNNQQINKRRYFARPISLMTAFAALVVLPVATIALTPAVARAQAEEKDVERAEMSRLADVRLPDGAYRSANPRDLARFAGALQQIAQRNHGKMTKTETLIWRGDDRERAMKDLSARL